MSESAKGRHASAVDDEKGVRFRAGAVTVVGAVAAAGVLAFISVTGPDKDDPAAGGADTDRTAVVAPVSAAAKTPVDAIWAEPQRGGGSAPLALNGPADVRPGSQATLAVRWTTADGEPVDGTVDLQRVVDNSWVTLSQVTVEAGSGTVDVQVEKPTIYRLAYGGSEQVEPMESAELVVTTGRPLDSRVTATAESDDGAVAITAGWTTVGGVPIIGDLDAQQANADDWESISVTTTGPDGTGTAEVAAEQTSRFRFSYPGGPRFGPVVSDEALVLDDSVRTIPVSTCADIRGVDVLDRGAACHWTPVTQGTFVVAHDYLGNAWWNSAPMGSNIQLTGEDAGLYEVVDRVIAPARGAALGSATTWWCDGQCDVVLQTCQGQNTGFTWLRRVGDVPT